MEGLIKIIFPEGKTTTRNSARGDEIFDPVRKYWIALTPEEWVRQHFIQFLLSKGYPLSLIAVEKKILVNQLTRRCDIVVYTREMKPFLIVECKRTDVALSDQVLQQVLRYHIPLNAPFLMITNGNFTMGFEKKIDRFLPINFFPEFPV